MTSVFVDTNVFLRFLTLDDDGQAARAKSLFKKAEKGRIRLFTGPPVLFEIAWTLKAGYKRSHEEILNILETLVSTPWLDMPDKDLAGEAVTVARLSGQDFADAYMYVSARKSGIGGIATFNSKHFEKMDAKLAEL
jgi:predicted nucleic-acid-binding protein